MPSLWSSRHAEQILAPEQQNAGKSNAGAENNVAQRTPKHCACREVPQSLKKYFTGKNNRRH